jgi:nitrile hydratase subunit beta
MNGIHDMGGMHGFGAIPFVDDTEIFHGDWERRMFALNVAAGGLGLWNIDKSRAKMESLSPHDYLRDDLYFRRFLLRLEALAIEHGLATQDEIEAGKMLVPARENLTPLAPEQVPVMVARGFSSKRAVKTEPQFKVGDAVRARMISPRGHTRLPRYARAHKGVIVMTHGVHVFPDHSSQGNEDPQWLYAVRFAGSDIWGEDCEPGVEVVLDAFEPYLDRL